MTRASRVSRSAVAEVLILVVAFSGVAVPRLWCDEAREARSAAAMRLAGRWSERLLYAQAQTPPGSSQEGDLKKLDDQESERSRKRLAAHAKKTAGVIVILASIAGGGALGYLAYAKRQDEKENDVPEDKRTSGAYALGAFLGGMVGISIGSGIVHSANRDLRATDNHAPGLRLALDPSRRAVEVAYRFGF